MNYQAKWLWYPGDLEKYHALKQNFSRVERGCSWPAFWKSDGFRQRVVFRRTYRLETPESFTVFGPPGAAGYADVNGRKYPFGQPISCEAGEIRIGLHIGCIGCVPAVYVQGDVICSDGDWTVEDYCDPPVPAASNRYFTEPEQNVAEWPMMETSYAPVAAEEINGGALFSFETELTAELEVNVLSEKEALPLVYLGESQAEALAGKDCYFFCRPDPETRRCPRQAMRYAFLPGYRAEEVSVRAHHRYVDIPVRASFHCGDEELNRIFAVAAHTFSLCCDVFFLDGVKRDKWIWSGDAYQSLFVNRYLTGDKEIEQRTLIALRGNDPVTTHINTILDYSLLWILAMGEHEATYHDEAFLHRMWPQMVSLMALLMGQRDEHGFIVGREQDWVFIDWADFDRDGPLCAEQMLLAAAYGVMARYGSGAEKAFYEKEKAALLAAIDRSFWDAEKRAYVDSFTSGNRHVTRHANILAVVFDLVCEERKREIAKTVLFNDSVPAITTPYFRFFELDALCKLGYLKEVLAEIKSYWGGMLKLGAVTFWEEYDPSLPLEKQYAMYGDPFGKSLCHAWAASPIYLLARYFVGLQIDPASPIGYNLHPADDFFSQLDCVMPVKENNLTISIRGGQLITKSSDALENGEE
ncbi:MAG: alpha-L-rhamnosidase [Clostridia bacterium]|nr:alpha-L-rhamnosidase [Clostridia bacterium]